MKFALPDINWSATWRRALCHGMWGIFDDETRESEAVAICARCPIMHECRQRALALPEKYGVWGGLTESERRTLLFRRKRVHCPGCGGTSVVADVMLSRVELCQTCGLSWRV